jgi:hypothetical protein
MMKSKSRFFTVNDQPFHDVADLIDMFRQTFSIKHGVDIEEVMQPQVDGTGFGYEFTKEDFESDLDLLETLGDTDRTRELAQSLRDFLATVDWDESPRLCSLLIPVYGARATFGGSFYFLSYDGRIPCDTLIGGLYGKRVAHAQW